VKYEQRNPLPVPEDGPYQTVRSTIDAIFDWQYELRRHKLLDLYEKGKSATWNATDLDWTTDVDIERIAKQREQAGTGGVINQLLNPPRPLSSRESVDLNLNMNAFMLSQFLHGEQGALLATAKIVETVPWQEAKWYAANQVADEARHVEVYHRYLTEKLGLSYEVHPSLKILLDDILSDPRWDVTYLGMQIMVEGLALAAFGFMKMTLPEELEMSEAELREREDFVIEATHLLRERLLMQPVFERLGWDLDVWLPWAVGTPFMRGFRQMLFSKIVPNLKRLGLLTPRVRGVYEKLDLLRFEHLKDSVEEPEAAPPQEIVQLLMQILAGPRAAQTSP
jgi:hypothetical protein